MLSHKSLPLRPLFNRIPDPSPERSVTSIKIKPNSHRFTDQILLRYEPRRVRFIQPPAVLAVIPVVAHEEIVPRRHYPFAGSDAAVGKHNAMVFGVELFESGGNTRVVPEVLLRPRVYRSRLLGHELVVDVQLVVLVDPDAVAGQADQALDVIDFRIR